MSADLFAEFQDLSQPRAPSIQSQSQPAQAQKSSLVPDPFNFSATSTTSTAGSNGQAKTQPWPALQENHSLEPLGGTAGGGFSGLPSKYANEGDDDAWGDFEVSDSNPSTSQLPISTAAPPSKTTSATRPPPKLPALQRTRIVRAPTIELMTNSLIDIHGANSLPEEVRSPPWMQTTSEHKKPELSKAAKPKPPAKAVKLDTNVLFDADEFGSGGDDNGEDDFGEFVETPAQAPLDIMADELLTSPATAKKTPSQLLSALNLNGPTSPYPQAPRSPSFHDRNPFPGLALNTPIEFKKSHDDNPKSSPVTAWPTLNSNVSAGSEGMGDDWGAFDDFLDSPNTSKNTKASNENWEWDALEPKKPVPTASRVPDVAEKRVTEKESDSSWAWDPVDVHKQPSEDKSPPINVPPPSILLSIFPQLFSQANASLYKPIGGQPFSVKNRILSDSKTIEFFRGYLHLATVAARIMAGRKQRWHRDKFLSQGMSISAAGSKGMKLAGVDKSQTVREDREASEILDIWKEHMGRLRSLTTAANSSIKNPAEQLKIPELRENMPVQTAKTVPTAPKACVICGLKRDERVARVDFEVEDSFGEWWTDHWGHTSCKRFWLQHENALRQR